MKTIHKYPVPLDDNFVINMPEGAEILTVQLQFKRLQMWAIVDDNPDLALEPRNFRLLGTGHELKPQGSYIYISTIQMHDGTLVFHVFECVNAVIN